MVISTKKDNKGNVTSLWATIEGHKCHVDLYAPFDWKKLENGKVYSVSWSALGDVPPSSARQYAELIIEAARIADAQNKSGK